MTTSSPPKTTGMKAFLAIWLGQFISLMGSAMTAFAIPIYIFSETQRVQELALLNAAFMVPLLIMSPIAGTIVDRYSRKVMMIVSDLGAAAATLIILLLLSLNQLEIWHLILANIINGTFQSFQWPAYSAAISVLLPKEQYGRAHGLTTLSESGSGIFAPVLAGALLGFIGLKGILLIDLITVTIAVLVLLFIHIPTPPRTIEGQQEAGHFWRETWYGFRYIWQRPSLLGIQMVFFSGNFLSTIAWTTLAAMILFRTQQDSQLFALIMAIGSVGGIVGGIVMSAWGGPKRRINGILWGFISMGLGSMVLMGLGQLWIVWAIALFINGFLIPITNGSNQAIWQAKVAPDVQGRVFSVRRLIAWSSNPLANLIAIPLADNLLEPAMAEGGILNPIFRGIVGSGPGSGLALLFLFGGVLVSLVGFSGYLFPAVRDAEKLLPDHDEMARVVEEAAT